MDRRRFLQWLGLGAGAVALEQAIPLNRVWSFPKNIVVMSPGAIRLEPGEAVQFIKAWDPERARMLCRLDVLFGFNPYPDSLAITNQSGRAITVPLPEHFPHVPPLAVEMLCAELKERGELYRPTGMFGVHYSPEG
jgi:hypothetical protein